MTIRSGFHKPDPPVNIDIVYKKRFKLLDINWEFYHQQEPQHLMNYHNPDVITGVHGTFYILLKFVCMGIPFLSLLAYLVKNIGGNLQPYVMPVEEDWYRAAELFDFIKANKLADYKDFLGRNNGGYYRTTIQQDFGKTPHLVRRLNRHGFSY